MIRRKCNPCHGQNKVLSDFFLAAKFEPLAIFQWHISQFQKDGFNYLRRKYFLFTPTVYPIGAEICVAEMQLASIIWPSYQILDNYISATHIWVPKR